MELPPSQTVALIAAFPCGIGWGVLLENV